MKCPKCTMENGPDAKHCEFCYETLRGHSAAETYLKHLRRAREREASGEQIEIKKPVARPVVTPPPVKIPWARIGAGLSRCIKAYWRPALIVLGCVVAFLFIETGLDPATRFRYLGTRLGYTFPNQTPVSYIVGFTIDAQRWSERSGQMDTPLGDLKIEELGTVNILETPGQDGRTHELSVSSNNWLLNVHRKKGTESHSLSAISAMLAPAHVLLDAQGRPIRRQQGPSIRIAKSAQLLTPVFPKGRVRQGQTWTDAGEWTDAVDGWTFYWSAQRTWRAERLTPCGDDTCMLLTYDATLTPQITNQPEWMANAAWRHGAIHGAGEVVFDTTRHRLVSHQLTYEAQLRARIPNLSQIPRELRVGRRAFPTPGEIVFALKNTTSLQRN